METHTQQAHRQTMGTTKRLGVHDRTVVRSAATDGGL